MKVFNNIKSVRTKILVLALAVAAIAAAIGGIGMSRLGDVSGNAEDLYDKSYLPYQSLSATSSHLSMGYIMLQGMMMAPTPEARDAAYEMLRSEWDAASAAFDAYEATDLSGKEAQVAEVRAAFDGFRSLLEDKAIPMILDGDLAGFAGLAETEEFTSSVAAYQASLDQLIADESAEAAADAVDARDTASSATTTLLVFILVGLGLALGLGYVVARAIANPLRAAQDTLDKVADGDLTQRLEVGSKDEVGRMAASLNRMLEKTSSVVRAIGENSTSLASSSEELSNVAQQMGASAEETSAQATGVSTSAEQVSSNVQTVATAAEEMGASIKEIAGSANEAARVATTAVSVAESTNATVTKLGDSSAEIGEVIKVITSIAEQTNLLALNATIEAARAGEAGKGFAVVANEVKELAKETARATDEIGGKIVAIQADARAAVDAIAEITSVINQINGIQTTIASAVEEQTATTNEIIRSVTEAAGGSTEIAASVSGIAGTAHETSTGAVASLHAAGDLARMAEELKYLVSQFVVDQGASGSDAVVVPTPPARRPATPSPSSRPAYV
jgi:methyl-accepting chemotaxis protein